MPGYFCFFGGYEVSRYLLTPEGKTKEEIGPLRTVLCGGIKSHIINDTICLYEITLLYQSNLHINYVGIGGVILWTAIFPTDVVKSRIQINKLNITLLACMRDIYQKEGMNYEICGS